MQSTILPRALRRWLLSSIRTAGAITVAVFAGETAEEALRRHCELRPEHRGRPVRNDFRPNKRWEVHELSAVWVGATENDFHEFRREMDQMWGETREVAGVQFVTEFSVQSR